MPQFTGFIDFPGDTDAFFVQLAAGRRYFIELEGSATTTATLSDPLLRLFRGTQLLAVDDDGGVGLNARISVVPSLSGLYVVEAAAFGRATGSYRLRVFEDEARNSVEGAGPAGAVGTGGAARGVLDYSGDADIVVTTLIAGLTYTIDHRGRATGGGTLSDPYLYLRDRFDRIIAQNDDGGSGLDSRLAFTPAATGQYFLQAREFGDNGTGSYTLSVSAGRGTSGADRIVGTDRGDAISGLGGNDLIGGRGGNDVLRGGNGSDSLIGGAGRDILLGDAGRDILRGQAGADLLIGGPGPDVLIGGPGPDVFRFAAPSDSRPGGRDVIRAGDGAGAFQAPGPGPGDRIDLRGIDANATTPGNDAFAFGTAEGIGRLYVVEIGQNTVIRGNVDFDPFPEFELVIADGAVRAFQYTAADFLLA